MRKGQSHMRAGRRPPLVGLAVRVPGAASDDSVHKSRRGRVAAEVNPWKWVYAELNRIP